MPTVKPQAPGVMRTVSERWHHDEDDWGEGGSIPCPEGALCLAI